MTADGGINGAMVHASRTADTTQDIPVFGTKNLASAIIQEHHMEILWPVLIGGTFGASGKGCVYRHVLAGGRTPEEPDHGGGIFQGRHHFFNRAHHHMGVWQGLGKIAISFISPP